MKQFLFIIFSTLIFLSSCDDDYGKERFEKSRPMYQKGDIVYLKPDSLKGVIIYSQGLWYRVAYYDSLKTRHDDQVYPQEIYGK